MCSSVGAFRKIQIQFSPLHLSCVVSLPHQVCRSNRWCVKSRQIIRSSTTTSVTRRTSPKRREDPATVSRAPQRESPPVTLSIAHFWTAQSKVTAPVCSVCSWWTGVWSECSRSCNGGLRTREVLCKRRISSMEEKVLDDSACSSPHPSLTEPCSNNSCPPEWLALDWSEVLYRRRTRIRCKHSCNVFCQLKDSCEQCLRFV